MVLPNIYFFARGSNDPAYLDKTDNEVLREWCKENVIDPALVSKTTARLLSDNHVLPESQAFQRVNEVLSE